MAHASHSFLTIDVFMQRARYNCYIRPSQGAHCNVPTEITCNRCSINTLKTCKMTHCRSNWRQAEVLRRYLLQVQMISSNVEKYCTSILFHTIYSRIKILIVYIAHKHYYLVHRCTLLPDNAWSACVGESRWRTESCRTLAYDKYRDWYYYRWSGRRL